MSDEPFVSVIVPTYNRREMLEECIDSLLDQTYPADRYEVIAVNDGSTDETDSFLTEYSKEKPSLRFFLQSNLGAAAARNLGIEKALGDIVCFTDDDCIADKDWIRSIVGSYADENVGGVGGRIISHNTISLAGRYTEEGNFFDQENLAGIFIVGANSSYRKDILLDFGGYDVQFKYSEDVDAGIRARMMGYRLVYAPGAIVLHKHRLTLKGVMRQVYGYGKGYGRLHKKYPDYFNPGRRMLILLLRLARKIILTPFKVLSLFFVKDKHFKLLSFFLDMGLLASESAGVAVETCFGRPYFGRIIRKKLDYIKDAKLPYGWGT